MPGVPGPSLAGRLPVSSAALFSLLSPGMLSSPPHEVRCGLQAACEEEERQDNHDPERPECAPVIVVFVLQVRDQLRAEVLLCDLAVPERPEPGAGMDEAERDGMHLLVHVTELSEERRRL